MRLLPGSSGEHRDTDLYWRYELWTRRRHSEIDSLFTTTGCIYALRRELAVALPPDTLSDDAYLSLIAFSRGYRAIFDPQAIAFDYPAVAGTEFRRRWRNWQGVGRSICACRGYSPRPIACGSIFCLTSSRGLCCRGRCWQFWRSPRRWRCLTAGSHRRLSSKRLSSPARTFLLMNAAVMAALAMLFIPAQKALETDARRGSGG